MKKYLFPFLAVLLFTACKKQTTSETEPQAQELADDVAAKGMASKIDVCHYDAVNNSWHTINISLNAWPAHQSHGDVRLDDQDGDGYIPNNECGVGPMGDCNDLNAAINPGVPEICGNGIDDNCNGLVDEENCIPVVTLCDQTWMQKNLDVSKYRNGDDIPQVTDFATWNNLTTGAWCYYNNDPANGAVYGKLYNWYAVTDPRGLAPAGWHVPSSIELSALSACLGGDAVAGGKIKSTGTIEGNTGLWLAPNTGATNSSGFTGLPGGYRINNNPGNFYNLGGGGLWASSTPASPIDFSGRVTYKYTGSFSRVVATKYSGVSVRCVRD